MFKKILIYLSFIAIAFTQASDLNDAFNQFGIDLFKELNNETDSDLLISPTSIGYALMMTNLGATGATSENILSVLNLSDSREEYYSDLSDYIQKNCKSVKDKNINSYNLALQLFYYLAMINKNKVRHCDIHTKNILIIKSYKYIVARGASVLPRRTLEGT